MKNIDYVAKQVANKKGMDEEKVKKILNYYWYEGIRKAMYSFDDTGIFIRGVGTIMISKYNITVEIKEILKRIRRIRMNSSYTKETKNRLEADYIEYFRKLWARRSDVNQIHYDTKQKRIQRKLEANGNNK